MGVTEEPTLNSFLVVGFVVLQRCAFLPGCLTGKHGIVSITAISGFGIAVKACILCDRDGYVSLPTLM